MKSTYLLALAAFAIAASTGFSQTSIPITNHSFETPTGFDIYQNGSGSSNYVTGWTTNSTGDIFDIQTSPVLTNQDGAQHLEAFSYSGANGGGTVSQVLTTSFVTGYEYTLTAYAGPEVGGNNSAQIDDTFFIANSSGTVLASTVITAITNDVMSPFTVSFTSTGLLGDTGAIEIGFKEPGQGLQSDMEIDNFSLTATAPVPEPSSIALAGLGGFGLLGLVRRRRA